MPKKNKDIKRSVNRIKDLLEEKGYKGAKEYLTRFHSILICSTFCNPSLIMGRDMGILDTLYAIGYKRNYKIFIKIRYKELKEKYIMKFIRRYRKKYIEPYEAENITDFFKEIKKDKNDKVLKKLYKYVYEYLIG